MLKIFFLASIVSRFLAPSCVREKFEPSRRYSLDASSTFLGGFLCVPHGNALAGLAAPHFSSIFMFLHFSLVAQNLILASIASRSFEKINFRAVTGGRGVPFEASFPSPRFFPLSSPFYFSFFFFFCFSFFLQLMSQLSPDSRRTPSVAPQHSTKRCPR